MSSTLLDLQRMNLKKMESAETPQPATSVETPSNEVSIIPLRKQPNDAMMDDTNIPSTEGMFVSSSNPSSEQVDEDLDEQFTTPSRPNRPSTRKPTTTRASKAEVSKLDAKELPKDALRMALDAQLRVHLMEQLMPLNGKAPVTRLNVEMPEDLHQQLKQHCVKTRTPIKALINALIALYLEAEAET